MSGIISLAIAIHNHQPVGNFDFVFEENYKQAYLPFLDILERYPGIKISLHQSGPLLEWLLQNKPDYCFRVKELVKKGQIEILGGGYYEPILPIIPDEDKVGQITTYSERLKELFGVKPRGIWLAERVWEPHLPKPLNEAKVEYLLVDENHFTQAGLSHEDMFGYYITEELGSTLKIFPILETLRHYIPFKPPEEIMNYLKSIVTDNGSHIAVFGDDGEKFGGWPNTYKNVYEDGWLERFFSLVEENSSWLRVVLLKEYLDSYPPLGRIYLPGASYTEMEEWTLPAKIQPHYLSALNKHEYKADLRRFIRGGNWRNFFIKYPESNRIHKMMLRVSKKIWQMQDSSNKTKALHELWKGECNCAYWHGVFGGLYLPHLRAALYHHLIAAEILADDASHKKEQVNYEICDFDKDGKPEILITQDNYSIMLKPDPGGTITELCYRSGKINLLATMTRRQEGYHQKVRELAKNSFFEQSTSGSIHEIVRIKEGGMEQKLHYDWHEKTSLIDHILRQGTTQDEFQINKYGEEGDFVNQPYQFEIITNNTDSKPANPTIKLWRDGHFWNNKALTPLRIEKNITTQNKNKQIQISYILSHNNKKEIYFVFGIEWNLAFLTDKDSSSMYYIDRSNPKLFSQNGTFSDAANLEIIDAIRNLKTTLSWDIPGTLWVQPLGVISQSENGFENLFQQLNILHFWNVKHLPASNWKVSICFETKGINND